MIFCKLNFTLVNLWLEKILFSWTKPLWNCTSLSLDEWEKKSRNCPMKSWNSILLSVGNVENVENSWRKQETEIPKHSEENRTTKGEKILLHLRFAQVLVVNFSLQLRLPQTQSIHPVFLFSYDLPENFLRNNDRFSVFLFPILNQYNRVCQHARSFDFRFLIR